MEKLVRLLVVCLGSVLLLVLFNLVNAVEDFQYSPQLTADEGEGNQERRPTGQVGEGQLVLVSHPQGGPSDALISKQTEVIAVSAWVSDEGGRQRSEYSPGEELRLGVELANVRGEPVKVVLLWVRRGPCGETTLWLGELSLPPDGTKAELEAHAPLGCAGKYTSRITVILQNGLSSQQASFEVVQ